MSTPPPSVSDLTMSRLDRSTSLDSPPEKTIFRIDLNDDRPLPSTTASLYAASEAGSLHGFLRILSIFFLTQVRNCKKTS
ncbi:unnamed protein product [Haemonchus placei]|uniref:Velvet domain-containing protein n=1 Tax=Haemonchus placei TaxID=6290 RepID=A0A0N4X4A0_HAEPC|nr:unnamed protein product [Haemonchus placei]